MLPSVDPYRENKKWRTRVIYRCCIQTFDSHSCNLRGCGGKRYATYNARGVEVLSYQTVPNLAVSGSEMEYAGEAAEMKCHSGKCRLLGIKKKGNRSGRRCGIGGARLRTLLPQVQPITVAEFPGEVRGRGTASSTDLDVNWL